MKPSIRALDEAMATISAAAAPARGPAIANATYATATTAIAPNKMAIALIAAGEPPVKASHNRNSTSKPCGRSTHACPYSVLPDAHARATARYPPSSDVSGVTRKRARRATDTPTANATATVGNRSEGLVSWARSASSTNAGASTTDATAHLFPQGTLVEHRIKSP